MLKVKIQAPGEIEYLDVPIPELNEEEALIKVKSVGLCYSDVAPYKGYNLDILPLPMVQGHEFGGVIEKINTKSSELKAGDKVVVFPMTECGHCYYCKHGLGLLCENQKMYGSPAKEGGMAEYVAVPMSKLIKLDEDFDIKYAGLIEPTTVAYRAVGHIIDSNVVIIGTGAIGMLMTQICKANNKVIAMDISREILDIANDNGVDLTVNVKDPDKTFKIKSFLGKEKVDTVVLTFFNQENLDFAMDIIRKDGTIAFMSMPKKVEVDFTPMLFKALKIASTISYNKEMFEKAVDIVQHNMDYKKMVTKMFPMNKAKEAFDYKGDIPSLKIMLTEKKK